MARTGRSTHYANELREEAQERNLGLLKTIRKLNMWKHNNTPTGLYGEAAIVFDTDDSIALHVAVFDARRDNKVIWGGHFSGEWLRDEDDATWIANMFVSKMIGSAEAMEKLILSDINDAQTGLEDTLRYGFYPAKYRKK